MEYEAFNYVGASFFGVPLIAITVGLLVILSGLGAAAVYKFAYRGQRPVLLVSSWALVALLFSAALIGQLSAPNLHEQKDQWTSDFTQKLNSHYGLELSPEQGAFLSNFNDFPNEDTVYGPTLRLLTGDEPQEFTSLVLAKSGERVDLLQLVGADYVPVEKPKA